MPTSPQLPGTVLSVALTESLSRAAHSHLIHPMRPECSTSEVFRIRGAYADERIRKTMGLTLCCLRAQWASECHCAECHRLPPGPHR